MSYLNITKSIDVDVDIDIDMDELNVDDLIKALKHHEENGHASDKEKIRRFKLGLPPGKRNGANEISLNDVLKAEAFDDGRDRKSLSEIQSFFSL